MISRSLRVSRARCACGAEATFEATERTLGLPPLMIHVTREPASHLATVRRSRPAPARVARVEVDNRLTYAEGLATEPVIVLRVVPGIGHHRIQWQHLDGLPEGRRELGRVLRWPATSNGVDDQVRAQVHHRGELWPRRRR
jgi:hypothetical protein